MVSICTGSSLFTQKYDVKGLWALQFLTFSHLWVEYLPDQPVCALSSFAFPRAENMVTCSFFMKLEPPILPVFLYPSVGPYPDATCKNPFLNSLSFSPLWQWLSFSPGGINKIVLSFDLCRGADLPLLVQWGVSLCRCLSPCPHMCCEQPVLASLLVLIF